MNPFEPRIHENGRICCSNPKYLCAACTTHFRVAKEATNMNTRTERILTGVMRALSSPEDIKQDRPRAASRHPSEPPNPYAKFDGIRDVLRPSTDPAYQPKGAPPDGYAIHLALLAAQAAKPTPPKSNALPLTSTGTPDPWNAAAVAAHHRSRS